MLFFDLNGLKQVNDEQGHKVGDLLIQNTAKNICTIFGDKSFRIGGDEFVILFPSIEENVFLDKVQKVRTMMTECKINISIGDSWKHEEFNIDDMLKVADKKMYDEKKAYYENKSKNNDRRGKRIFF